MEFISQKQIKKSKNIPEDSGTSSEEEDTGQKNLDKSRILSNLYKYYKLQSHEGAQVTLRKTTEFLENTLSSGTLTCLICIGSIRTTNAVWSCNHCYCCFHLNCICRWARDSLVQHTNREQQSEEGYYNYLGEFIPPKSKKPAQWCCPQCRYEYTPEEQPTSYECFCGKEINPLPHPFLIPHSCGNICSKPLQPNCGHNCTLLCHPGPCPPCSQYASTTCKCQKTSARIVRCVEKHWQCENKCNIKLPCGHHCITLCHPINECPPCEKIGEYSCECGQEIERRKCSESKWKCKRICGKMLSCDLHKCQDICHSGECKECPMSLPRSCPCGKTKQLLPCSMNITVCGDTCHKLLKCGQHTCTQRCHKGECNVCLVMVKKRCRCMLHEKELPCSKCFVCETKCKQMRTCGKHACNKKCCDKNCPPCEKICNKPLKCGKHKCQSVCHKGPCFPCDQKSKIKCSCGKTVKDVPCGHERKARIFCNKLCRIPSKCHHNNMHHCHQNDCPPCSKVCGLPNTTTNCEHICTAICHAAIKVPTNTDKSAIRSYNKYNKKLQYISEPHPECDVKVLVVCIGGHEITRRECKNSQPISCGFLCNRQLSCGNHKCTLLCHTVANEINFKAQDGCMYCHEVCRLPRAEGCTHKCPLPCHQPPCSPCNVTVKTNCHCGRTQLALKCSDYNMEGHSGPNRKEALKLHRYRLKCCGTKCSKNYPCGHPCASICHPGPCPNAGECQKKLQIYCKCKHQSIEVRCGVYQEGNTYVDCNEDCIRHKSLDDNTPKQKVSSTASNKHIRSKNAKRKPTKPKQNETRSDIYTAQKHHLFGFLIFSILVLLVAVWVFFKNP